ncbi:MAG: Unknown protein [uncultured Thiotrichaceae bacterium]|uniref:Uroporphyrinogen-III C-methyltransferase n=1 Tax=uncultured Thiotrichaceae bacterium TaxID=298394 RepID=A0A6S6U2H0_9GAMM|nr:MAG: Unknown protein [uncultured Thiotrichaceae bacterium]
MHARNLNKVDKKPLNDPFDYSDKSKSTDPTSDAHQPSASRTARFASYLAIVALCFTALGVTVGYKHWLRISDKAKDALSQIQVIQSELDAKANTSALEEATKNFESISQANTDKLNSTLEQLSSIKEETLYAASTVSTHIEELTLLQAGLPQIRTRMTRAEVRLAEIRFLLESARNRLILSYDKTGALALLKAADLMLLRIGSADLLPVRELLIKDISQLEQYALPDTRELLSTITNIEESIQPLSKLTSAKATTQPVNIFNTSEEDKSLTAQFKNYVNNSISITKDTQPPKEILNLANKQRTDQLMKLRLTTLRLNVLERQDSEFHFQIKEINKMLDKYYLPEQNMPWKKELSAMDELSLTPEAPSIDSALQLIKSGLSKDNKP